MNSRIPIASAAPLASRATLSADYSFPEKLNIGDRIIFHDMAHYTMVKNNTFNGVRLPSIVKCNTQTDKSQIVKKFSYEDYRDRLS